MVVATAGVVVMVVVVDFLPTGLLIKIYKWRVFKEDKMHATFLNSILFRKQRLADFFRSSLGP